MFSWSFFDEPGCDELSRFEVTVGPVAHGGHCVARHEGRVVFVRHALPGERVVVSVTEDRQGSFWRADAVEVLEASPDRVVPPCPVAVPGGCGGCDWQHVSAERQRSLKADVVAEQLRRLAGIDREVVVEALPGDGLLHWRTRTRLAVDAHGKAGFRGHRSHAVVTIDGCPIAAQGTVDKVVDRDWAAGAELSVAVDSTGETFVAEGRRPVSGGSTAHERAAGRDWTVAPHGFWQVHPAAADTFAQVVREWAAPAAGEVAWDLYAGVGLFASILAAQVGAEGTVVAVESDRRAAEQGADNLADLPQVRVFAGRVEAVLDRAQLPDPRVVVLDPPRKGAGSRIVKSIARRRPDRVVYVACDPAALARDLASFAERGYDLTDLRAFDAFPMTHHVECVALLNRR
ncbi:class I SAM-dependent RNA methyltransferase [Tenggerimyces flavus]|uniref:Class I SAM-dependent RNA methyltransferase n=1 Tax=Tenggerimyces flavus TaxID=1708749 RepID=A0ABV7YFE5_9ACTN|nr:TRAM domain-containing protein [Tenggerimyces flavus]MBM7791401.1 tRNA/tmRNA/rRNA uracil-C5-methylase (TrmA/RlmC/RlmD family) [Tenggerimyces flavus]